MTKEDASGWNGFVLEKDGKIYCMLKKEGPAHPELLSLSAVLPIARNHFWILPDTKS